MKANSTINATPNHRRITLLDGPPLARGATKHSTQKKPAIAVNSAPAYGQGKVYNSRQSKPFGLGAVEENRLLVSNKDDLIGNIRHSMMSVFKARDKCLSVFDDEKLKNADFAIYQPPGPDKFLDESNEFEMSSASTVYDYDYDPWAQSLRISNFWKNMRDNGVFIIYLIKSFACNVTILSLVCYINLYHTAIISYLSGKSTLMIAANRYTMVTFVYEHVFIMFLTLVMVLTNNNYLVLCNLVFTIVLGSLEFAYYGYQMRHSLPQSVLQQIASNNGNMAVVKLIESALINRPFVLLTVLLVIVAISILLEGIIYFLWLGRYNLLKLQNKSSQETLNDAIKQSGSIAALEKIEKKNCMKAMVFLNCLVGPSILFIKIVNYENEPFFYMAILSLILMLTQLSLAFVPVKLFKKTHFPSTAIELFITIFNLLVIIQILASVAITGNTSVAGMLAFSVGVLFIGASYYLYYSLVVSSVKEEEEEDRFYNQVDVKFLISQVVKYRKLVLGVVFISGLVFNIIQFAIYLKFRYNYQWFMVIVMNLVYLPMIYVSLDLESRNFHSYTAMMHLFFLQYVVFICNYTSIFYNLPYHTMIFSETGQFFALVFYSALFFTATCFFIKFKRHHSSYNTYLEKYLSDVKLSDAMYDPRDDDDDVSTINGDKLTKVSIRTLVKILMPLIHIDAYVSIVAMCLCLNYSINDFHYSASAYQELFILVLIVSFIKCIVARNRLYVCSPKRGKIQVIFATAMLFTMTLLCFILQLYFMVRKILLIDVYNYGSQNIEIRFQIGFCALSIAVLLIELLMLSYMLVQHVISLIR